MNGKDVDYTDEQYTGLSSIAVRKKADCRGFTLVELMIVVSIIGILAAIAVPNYQWSVIRAKEAVLRETLYNFRNSLDQFYADQGKYPDSLDDLKSKNYMRDIPKDPFTGSNTTWVTVEPPSSSSSSDSSSGDTDIGKVYDVHSGSDKISPTNNLPYSDPSW